MVHAYQDCKTHIKKAKKPKVLNVVYSGFN